MKKESILLPNAKLIYFPHFLTKTEAKFYFEKLNADINWQQDNITLFGKTYLQPRLTALFSTNKKNYSYSGIKMESKTFPESLLKIKNKIENSTQENFTSCLANLYRDGNDSNGWHADDEKELGKNPIIASLSLGQERLFHFKNKSNQNLKYKFKLKDGSLLIMKGETQHFWKHQLPKSKKQMGPRINLTFRKII